MKKVEEAHVYTDDGEILGAYFTSRVLFTVEFYDGCTTTVSGFSLDYDETEGWKIRDGEGGHIAFKKRVREISWVDLTN